MTEALRVLGLAHSASTAPRSQNIGLANRVSTSLVKTRALELAEAGLRVRIGEERKRALAELWLDWAGNVEWDAGFDEVMRRSKAGHDLAEAFAQELATCPAGETCGSLIDLHDTFGAAEAYRGDFLLASSLRSQGTFLRISLLQSPLGISAPGPAVCRRRSYGKGEVSMRTGFLACGHALALRLLVRWRARVASIESGLRAVDVARYLASHGPLRQHTCRS